MASIENLARRRGLAMQKMCEIKEQLKDKLGVTFPERVFPKAVDTNHEIVFKMEAFVEDFEIIADHVLGVVKPSAGDGNPDNNEQRTDGKAEGAVESVVGEAEGAVDADAG